jgi:L-lactate utilization protein LutC
LGIKKIRNGEARESIMGLIRTNLATSKRYDATSGPYLATSAPYDFSNSNHQTPVPLSRQSPSQIAVAEVVQRFKQNVEAVDGHCIVVQSEDEVEESVKRIVEGKRIATANGPRSDLFKSDVGITSAQAGIAETGTLVLDSSVERNRLVSLVPPIHIAILNASRIFQTLGETLAALQSGEEVSPAITFITGPSRTADIELTLAIGVHGPQELYVIVVQNN